MATTSGAGDGEDDVGTGRAVRRGRWGGARGVGRAAWAFAWAVAFARAAREANAGVDRLDPEDWGVWPSSQLNQNNLTVNVYGDAFFATNISSCRVGDYTTPLTYVSASEVRCTISPSLRLSRGFSYIEVSMNGFDFTSDRVTFALHDPVKLAHVFPYGFDIGGGGVLRLVGSNFAHDSSKCTFGAGGTGNVAAVSALAPSIVYSSAYMKCETPTFATVGMTDVSTRTWGTSGSLSGSRALEVWKEPCELEVMQSWNTSVSYYGGTSVVLRSASANEELVEPNNLFGYSCHFGTITVRAVLDALRTNSTVTCVSPAAQYPGSSVELWAGPSVDSFQPCTTMPTFTYGAAPSDESAEIVGEETLITYTGSTIAVVPVYVLAAGGSVVTVTGSSLSISSVCRVDGDATAPVRFVSSALIQCELLPHTEGEELLYALASGSTVESASIVFTALPTITSLSVYTGLVQGGTAVEVTGTNFKDTTDISCRFGTIGPVAASYLSTRKVSCVSPAHIDAISEVRVGRVNQESFSDSLNYSYVHADVLDAVLPSVVHSSGDTSLSLFWSQQFTASTGCRVSGVQLDPCTVSGSTTMGFVEVYSYHFVSDERVGDPAVFAYHVAPTLSHVTPTVVQSTIPTVMYMTGSSFNDADQALCLFGNNAVDATFVSTALVKCESHLPLTGVDDSQVGFGSADDDAVWSRTMVSLSIVPPLTISKVSPKLSVLVGGTTVQITGTGFDGVGGVFCRIGTVSYIEGRILHDKVVECISPSYFESTVDLQIAIHGNVYTNTNTSVVSFVYANGVDVVAVIPSVSPLAGGFTMRAYGLSGGVGEDYKCALSGVLVQGNISSFGEVQCTTPAGVEGFAAVGIGSIIDDPIDQMSMEYVQSPVISSVYPFNGPTSGGSLIRVSGSHLRTSSHLVLDGSESSSHFYSSALFVSELPPSSASVVLDVYAAADGNLVSNILTFTYRSLATLTSFTPDGIATSGGSVVYVTGTNMPNDKSLSCAFGTILVAGQWASSTSVECVSPSRIPGGGVYGDFRVYVDGIVSAEASTIKYATDSEITQILPPSLTSTQLPAEVTIFGSWLKSASCNGTVTAFDSSWASSFACSIDPTAVGYASIGVISRGEKLSVAYVIKETPLLLGVAPPGASVVPGEILSVSGQHLVSQDPSELYCLFDTSYAVSPYVISTALMKCESTSTVLASTRVSILGGDGIYGWSRQSAPVVSSVSPTSSAAIGGTTMTLSGTSMPLNDNSAVCSFGTIAPIAAQSITSTRVKCLSPAGVASNGMRICVSVYTTLSPSLSCVSTHVVERNDVLDAVLPSVVHSSGDTSLSLFWSQQFTASTGCRVSGVQLDPCTVSGSTTMGFVEVYSYHFVSDERVGDPAVFAYHVAPTLSHVTPTVVQSTIPTVMYMTGSSFNDADQALCLFGNNAVDATFVSTALVKCESHLPLTGVDDSQVGFGSADDDAVWSRTMVSLSIVPPLTISKVSPKLSVLVGGTTVQITGTGFDGVGGVFCRIGTVSYIEGRILHDKVVECISPSYFESTVDLQIAIHGNVYTNTNTSVVSFVYANGVDVVAVIPSVSPLAGGFTMRAYGLSGGVGEDYKCALSGVLVQGNISSFGEVQCTTPAGVEGFAAVGIGSIIDDPIDQMSMEYVQSPVISSVYPFNGPTSGGSLIRVSGSHLRTSSHLVLDGSESSSHFYSSALFVSELPPSSASVVLDVYAAADGNLVSNILTFTYRSLATLTSFTPDGIATSGGSVVYVTGTNMPNDKSLSCAFGTILVAGQWASSTSVECVSPSRIPGGGVYGDFRVYVDGIVSAEASTIKYATDSEITQILPPSLTSTQLPAEVTIFGSWLKSASCNGTVTAFDSSWASSFACSIDPTAVGYASIGVISRGEKLSVAYVIKETPLLLGVAPPGASVVPGEILSVSGQHLVSQDPSELYCLFDTSYAVSPYVISTALMKCESTSTVLASTRVSILGGDGIYGWSRQSAPVVSSVSPTSSAAIGGTTMTLSGTSMPLNDNSAVCSFGTIAPIAARFVSTTKVQCTTPAGVPTETKSVCVSVYTVSSPSISCASSTLLIVEASDPPVILDRGISSKRGGYFFLWRSTDSYTAIPTLATVQLGTGNATALSSISGVFIAPQLSGGFTPVSSIYEIGGTSFAEVMIEPITTITSASPKVTPAAGGGQVWITGKDLRSEVLRMSIDGVDLDYTIISSALVVVEVPAHASGGATIQAGLGTRLDANGDALGPWTSTGVDYLDGIDLEYIKPTIGPDTGLYTVHITGTGFTDSSLLVCRFGSIGPISASYVTGREIRCSAPTHLVGQVPVEVSANNRDFTFHSTIPSSVGGAWGSSTYAYWSATPTGTPATYRGVTFTYTRGPSHLDYVVPSSAPVLISAQYDIYGSSLSTSFVDMCSSINVTEATVASAHGSVTCSWNAVSAAGFVQVGAYAVLSTYSQYVGDQLQFEYYDALSLTNADPQIGSTEGGTVLFISGANFRKDDVSQNMFGSTAVVAHVVSSALSIVETPPFASRGIKTIYGSVYENAPSIGFSVVDTLLLSSVSPTISTTQGGSWLEITGDKFSQPSQIWCRAGTIGPFYARAYGSKTLRCISPAHYEADVNLQVSMNGRDWRYELTLSLANPALPSGSSYNSILTLTFTKAAKIAHVLPSSGHVTDATASIEAFYDAPYPAQNVATRSCGTGGTSLTSETTDTSGVYSMLCALQRDSFIGGFFPIIVTGPDAANTSFTGSFHYAPVPVVDAWSPEVVHYGGGTLVSLELTDASPEGMTCVFSPWYQNEFTSTVGVDAHFVSSALIVCESPPTEVLKSIGVVAGLKGTEPDSGQAEIFSLYRPEISSSTPGALAQDGGMTVTIVGENLGSAANDLYAQFGSISHLSVRWVTSEVLEVLSPAALGSSASIYLAHALSAMSDAYTSTISYIVPFEPAPLIPSVVPASGNAFVRLHAHLGSLQSSVPSCDLTNLKTTLCREATNIGGILTRINSPNFAVLQLPGGENTTVNVPQVAYVETSQPTKLQPSIAMVNGGTVIMLAGKNFVRGMTGVRVGDTALILPHDSIAFVSSAFLRFEAPTGTLQTSEQVRTSTGFADSDSWGNSGDPVSFYDIPQLSGVVSTSSLSGSGGSYVRIGGTGFHQNQDLVCKFSEVRVRATFISSKEIQCNSPALPLITTPLVVSNNLLDYSSYGLTSQVSGDVHVTLSVVTSLADLSTLPDVQSTFGPSSGGSLMTISGTGLFASDKLGCKFSNRYGSGFIISSDLGKCVTPAHEPGFVALQLSGSVAVEAVYSSVGAQFEYQTIIEFDMIFPDIGTVGGGTMLNVYGDNLIQSVDVVAHGSQLMPGTGLPGLSCRFGASYSTGAIHISSTIVRCETPTFHSGLINQPLVIDLSLDTVEWVGNHMAFEPISTNAVATISPTAGMRSGGTTVTFAGYFSPEIPVWCKFGSIGPIQATFQGDGRVRCKSPAKAAGDIPIALSRGNAIDFAFDYVNSIFKM